MKMGIFIQLYILWIIPLMTNIINQFIFECKMYYWLKWVLTITITLISGLVFAIYFKNNFEIKQKNNKKPWYWWKWN